MYSTAINLHDLYTLKGTEKIHTERFFKFPSSKYSILYVSTATVTVDYTQLTLILVNGAQTVTHLSTATAMVV